MPDLTFDEYQRIQVGMSYDQVVEIVGMPGERAQFRHIHELILNSWESEGRAKYQWVNSSGSKMVGLFVNGELIQKVQYGLNIGKQVYVIDGTQFSSLEEFARYFSKVALSDYQWNGNLDAFNDILRGGFGTPEEGFILRWENSALSRKRLGYPQTVALLKKIIRNCHPSSIPKVKSELREAKRKRGQTLFDLVVEIIQVHGPDGDESEDGVELQLL